MAEVHTTWVPKKRNCIYLPQPPEIPDWVYVTAQTAKQNYNENWEYWVWMVSQEHNCSQAVAEDACIRGIKQSILQMYHVYGDQVGRWFEDYLDLKDIFSKVKLPEFEAKLGG